MQNGVLLQGCCIKSENPICAIQRYSNNRLFSCFLCASVEITREQTFAKGIRIVFLNIVSAQIFAIASLIQTHCSLPCFF